MKHNVICYRKVFIGHLREAKTRWHAWNMTWAGCVQWFCEFIGCCIAPSCTTPGSCGSLILTICKLKMPSCYGASMIVTTMKWHRILRFAWYHTITMRFHLLFYMILYHARFLSHGVSVCVCDLVLYYPMLRCMVWHGTMEPASSILELNSGPGEVAPVTRYAALLHLGVSEN